jgi:acyl-coenzyme A synthetase/AMP-(fatty) acid ligase
VVFEGLQLPPDVQSALAAEEIPDPPTLPALLRRGVELWGDEELVVHDGDVHTWRDVDRASADVAKGLLAIGVTKGSRVGILMPNSVDWVVAFLAAARIGAVVSPLSTFLQGPELARSLAQADVQVLLCVDHYLAHDYVARLEQIPGLADATGTDLFLPSHPYLRHVVVWGRDGAPPAWVIGPDDLVAAAGASGVGDDLLLATEDAVSPADWFLTVWTSGTTSDPKGVVHTHGGVLRYCHGLRAIGRADVRRGERSYSALPFFWLGGLNGQVVPALLCGAVIVTTDRIRPDDVLDALVELQVRRLTGWLRPLAELRRAAADRGLDISGIRGLAPLRFPDGELVPPDRTGNALGMTETFGPVGAEAPGAILPPEKAGTMGRAVAGYEREIIDPETGALLPAGTIGELRVRGPGLMVGYYKREREDTFDADGFFRTGDRCAIDDDGFLSWHGREGDLIKTSGANVSPVEVEQLLLTRPDIAEAIVFGVPDAERDEAIAAVLVPARDAEVDVDELRTWLSSQISNYKVPHHYAVRRADEIPRTESAKVRKHVLARDVFPDAFAGDSEGATPEAR